MDTIKAVDGGAGVLALYGNYGGDVMNFGMATDLADFEDIKVENVVATDDVASFAKGEEEKRRGVAGMFFMYKVAAAKAERFATLDEVKDIAIRANNNVRTMGVALSPCTLPAVGKPTFQIKNGQMELGMGIHGEPGIKTSEIDTADAVAEKIMSAILEDLTIPAGSEVAVMINGLGATPLEEQYIIYRKVHKMLEEREVKVYRNYIGEYATSFEMVGLSISVFLLDDEFKELLDEPFETPFFIQK